MLTLEQLRQVLSEEIEAIRRGASTPARVNAISNATGKILTSVKVQIDYAKLRGNSKPSIPWLDMENDDE